MNIHILTQEQLFHFGYLPFQVVYTVRCDGDKQVEIIEILAVAQSGLQEVTAADRAVQIIKIRIGIAGFFDLTAAVTTAAMVEMVGIREYTSFMTSLALVQMVVA